MDSLNNHSGVMLVVLGNPVPKPRMTQKDKWAGRPIVIKYFKWKNLIRKAWLATGINTFDSPVCISLEFWITQPKPTSDLDNFIKGVKDSLTRSTNKQGQILFDGAFVDDNVRCIPNYIEPICCHYGQKIGRLEIGIHPLPANGEYIKPPLEAWELENFQDE